jgi:hypothetical protein
MVSLLDFRSECARRDSGHTGCVQKLFLGKTHPRGGEPRKNNISAEDHTVTGLNHNISKIAGFRPTL